MTPAFSGTPVFAALQHLRFRGRFRSRACAAPLVLGLAVALAACGKGDAPKQKGPTQVGYIVLHATSVPMVTELPGRTSAFRTAEVRPQVSGIIQKRLFTEGAMVRAGQPLYQIDARLYRAAANQASANLASARATSEAASAKAERYRPLAADKAVAAQDYTDAAATARSARASVAQTRAALQTAQVNLHFTTVPAPITGRIGRSLYTEGALATSDQTNPLAVISQLDPIYVDIQQSSTDMLALRRQMAVPQGQTAPIKVTLLLDDGQAFPAEGSLQFSEVTVDTTTGTVTLRARFPNAQGLLMPGMFVRARLNLANQNGVFLVPQSALTRDPRGNATVTLLTADGKTATRSVTAPRTWGQDWVVTQGLAEGDKLVTQGLGKLKPGQPVKAVPASTPQKPRMGKPGDKSGAAGSSGKQAG